MGAQESSLSESSSDHSRRPRALKAYHVLRVADSSPAFEAGIEPFFDYIVGIGGQAVTDDGDALTTWLDRSEGQSVTLQVYSSRRRQVRNIYALPNRKWSSGPSRGSTGEHQPSLLGLSLRLCNPENALTNVWHVLDIIEGSPAQDAGLVPFGDWIIGYAGGILRSENDLYEVVEEHEDRPLRLFVYSADYEVTREVVIVPNRSWGSGEGLLGCSIGFGLLHRIPRTTTQTTAPSFLIPAGTPYTADVAADDEEQRLLADLGKTSLMALGDVTQEGRFGSRSTSPSPERDRHLQPGNTKSSSTDSPPSTTLPSRGWNAQGHSVIKEEEEQTSKLDALLT